MNREYIYKQGLNDAWDLAQKIGGVDHPDSWDGDELYEIFGTTAAVNVFDRFSYQEALTKVEEYEKRKAVIPVIGDVVKVVDNGDKYNTHYGVYLGVHDNRHYIMERCCCAPTCFGVPYYTLEKMDQHIDLEGWTLED